MTDYFACNRCNNLMERADYCDNCGCPEVRELKDMRYFLSMGPNYDPVVKAVQESCTTQEVQALMALGDWEFNIERQKVTGWWVIRIIAPFEVWQEICKSEDARRLAKILDDILEDERMGNVREEVSDTAGEDATPATGDGV